MPAFPGHCDDKTIAAGFRFLLSRIAGAGGSGYTAGSHPAVLG
jgi:hypothetical protein